MDLKTQANPKYIDNLLLRDSVGKVDQVVFFYMKSSVDFFQFDFFSTGDGPSKEEHSQDQISLYR